MLQKILSLPGRYRPWRPRHFQLITSDLLKRKEPVLNHESHLEAAIDWLCHAQDVRALEADAGGVSAGWSFEDGWLPSYPETTGYIIETFLAASRLLPREDLVDRAQRMIDWELSLQGLDGAFPGHFGEAGSHPVIFNQGQILHGLVAGYLQLGRKDCLLAAERGAHWMVQQLDEDGCWRKYEHRGVPHVYNTRATWAMLATGLLVDDQRIILGARRNLDWALSEQEENGFYRTNAFSLGEDPFTHTIAYAIRGFLECGALLKEERYLQSAERAARAMISAQREDGWLAGTYDLNWQPSASYACLTGIAQMALCWLRLAQIRKDESLREPARRGIAYVKATQRLTDPDPIRRGGILGSRPIWGAYSRFEYPNWAAKFFADALMIDWSDRVVPPSSRAAVAAELRA